MTADFEAKLIALAEGADPAAVARLQAVLADGQVLPSTPPARVSHLMAPGSIAGHLLVPVLREWAAAGESALPGPALALALGVAVRAKERAESRAPRLVPVWTGPYAPPGVPSRATLAVMQEMVAGARRRILLVGYALTKDNPEAEGLVQALAQAVAQQRVQVAIALHDDGKNHATLLKLWPRRIPFQLLRWEGRPGVPKASLHAKLMVVDGHDLLITSANLTHLGLDKNIEFGVRIQGPFAHEIDRHFAALVRDAILVECPRNGEG